ncbi:MAG: hypothetical protein WEC39_02025 [Patescibacteria group bacterium]
MVETPLKETVLLEWEAPERVYKKHSPVYFRNLFVLLLILALVAAFFKQFLLAVLLMAVYFVIWALDKNAPKDTKYVISNLGVRSHGHPYTWDQMKSFCFDEVNGAKVLEIATRAIYPGTIYMVMDNLKKERIGEVLGKYLTFKTKAPKDVTEKIQERINRWFPLE